MTAAPQTIWSDRFIVRFAAWFAPGIAALMLALWIVVTNDVPQPHWFPQEGVLLVIAGSVWAIVSTRFALMSSWRDVFLAGVIAGVLHFAVYFLPLIFLLNAPFSPLLVAEMARFLGGLMLAYTVLLALAFLIQSRFPRPTKGQT